MLFDELLAASINQVLWTFVYSPTLDMVCAAFTHKIIGAPKITSSKVRVQRVGSGTQTANERFYLHFELEELQ